MPKQLQNSTHTAQLAPIKTPNVIAKAIKGKEAPKADVPKKKVVQPKRNAPNTRLKVKTLEQDMKIASVYKNEEKLSLT